MDRKDKIHLLGNYLKYTDSKKRRGRLSTRNIFNFKWMSLLLLVIDGVCMVGITKAIKILSVKFRGLIADLALQ